MFGGLLIRKQSMTSSWFVSPYVKNGVRIAILTKEGGMEPCKRERLRETSVLLSNMRDLLEFHFVIHLFAFQLEP